MDQIQIGLVPEFLQHLLANPAAANATHRQPLEALVQTYPACSIFRLLLAKSVQNADAETAEKAIQIAAVYAANREVLFKLIHQPETIVAVKPEKFYPLVSVAAEKGTENQNAVFSIENLSENKPGFAASYPVAVINTEENKKKNTYLEVTDAAYIEPNLAEIEDEEAVFVADTPSETNKNAAFIDPELEIVAADSVPDKNNNAVFIDQNLVKTDYAELTLEEVFPQETDAAFIEPKPAEIEDEEAVFVADIPFAEKNNIVFTDENLEEAMAAENDFRVEDVSQTFVIEADDELVFPEQTILASEENLNQKPDNQAIDEEVFDEITAIEDINFEVVKTASIVLHPPKPVEVIPETPFEITAEVVAETQGTSAQIPLTPQDEAEKAMLSNIAAIDYFTFNNKFGQNQVIDPEKIISKSIDYQDESDLPEIKQPENKVANEADTVSKYHDDKMPYTFMWWLDKTRKEYAGTYQPYIKNVQKSTDLSVGPELHQQYIESIFHTKAPLKVPEKMLPPLEELPVKKKEKQLIERFIIEEPHIHPPSMDKLDTENKAKKSSEDGDIFVTETLAKVYLDQMLYHKALDTYKKLMLKFPEKSVYFATQITEIEKKIN